MVATLSAPFVAAAVHIINLLGVTRDENTTHMVESVLLSCWNHHNQSEDTFLGDRARIIMTLLRSNSRDIGYNLNKMYRIIRIIREAQAEFAKERERDFEARLANMRAIVAARLAAV